MIELSEKARFTFFDESAKEELILPVTPSGYEINHGIKSEKISLTELGETNLPGKRYMMDIKISCMFPARQYSFLNPGALTEPYFYVRKFEQWCDSQTILRFIISGTNINTTCFIESIDFGEKDGTGDISAVLNVAQYRILKKAAAEIKAATGNDARQTETKSTREKPYTVNSGDTLMGICREVYGDASLYKKLAEVNGIKNPNLIYAGTVLKTPDKAKM